MPAYTNGTQLIAEPFRVIVEHHRTIPRRRIRVDQVESSRKDIIAADVREPKQPAMKHRWPDYELMDPQKCHVTRECPPNGAPPACRRPLRSSAAASNY